MSGLVVELHTDQRVEVMKSCNELTSNPCSPLYRLWKVGHQPRAQRLRRIYLAQGGLSENGFLWQVTGWKRLWRTHQLTWIYIRLPKIWKCVLSLLYGSCRINHVLDHSAHSSNEYRLWPSEHLNLTVFNTPDLAV